MAHGYATMVAPRARSKLYSACSSVIVDRVLANRRGSIDGSNSRKIWNSGQDHNWNPNSSSGPYRNTWSTGPCTSRTCLSLVYQWNKWNQSAAANNAPYHSYLIVFIEYCVYYNYINKNSWEQFSAHASYSTSTN
jgi:hypothetical protein